LVFLFKKHAGPFVIRPGIVCVKTGKSNCALLFFHIQVLQSGPFHVQVLQGDFLDKIEHFNFALSAQTLLGMPAQRFYAFPASPLPRVTTFKF